MTSCLPDSAILARHPFGEGVPAAWLPSLWLAMDRDWGRLPPALSAIDSRAAHWWHTRVVDTTSEFAARRRVFGDRGISNAVVGRSTFDFDGERLLADVANVNHDSLHLVADSMRDRRTWASTALLLSPVSEPDLRTAAVLLTATWISRHFHGEPLTSQCFTALLSLVRGSPSALALPFDVSETGESGVVLFGSDEALGEASKRLPSSDEDSSALVAAWTYGLWIPLLGE